MPRAEVDSEDAGRSDLLIGCFQQTRDRPTLDLHVGLGLRSPIPLAWSLRVPHSITNPLCIIVDPSLKLATLAQTLLATRTS